jgi:hypothetical protein
MRAWSSPFPAAERMSALAPVKSASCALGGHLGVLVIIRSMTARGLDHAKYVPKPAKEPRCLTVSEQVSRTDGGCWRTGLIIRRSWVRAPPAPPRHRYPADRPHLLRCSLPGVPIERRGSR